MARMLTNARLKEPDRGRSDAALAALRPLARPLRTPADLDPLLARVGDARYVRVVAMLAELRTEASRQRARDPEDRFGAEQDALVAANAERYYRAMVRGGAASWNVRDEHMVATLVYVHETRALAPLHMEPHRAPDAPETYPTGMSFPLFGYRRGPSRKRSAPGSRTDHQYSLCSAPRWST